MLLAIVPVAVTAWLIVSEARLPNNAQLVLKRYLARHGLSALMVVRAARPANFAPEMSAAVIGDSARYRTDADFSGQQQSELDRLQSQTAYETFGYDAQDPRMPLPYPPQEVWCVRAGDGGTPTVLFVALHQDLYNGAWLVHEADTSALAEALPRLGCTLNP
jgi:hypothetical protein